MRKNIVILLCGLLLALALFLREGTKRQGPANIQDSVSETAAAPVKGAALVPSAMVAPTQGAAADPAQEKRDEPPPVFFPKARVVARVREAPQADGRFRELETVETSMKERFVRVERTLAPDASGKLRLVSEVAMVANQILLMKPDGLDAAKFQEILRQAGAIDVKPVGAAFLATFEARPMDPKALEAYIARVREVAQMDITLEPNYIRKMF